MVSRNCRKIRTASHVQLVPNPERTSGDSLDFLGTEVRNNSLPFPDRSGTNVERPRDIRGALKVIDNVLLEHERTFTIVKTAMQPRCQSKALTLVDMHTATISERLTEAMKEADDTSASELARACGVSPAAVHKWLNGGRLSADNLAAAARALGVREEWLRTGKLPRERQNAEEDRQVDRVIGLLEDLQGPLAALSAAIEQLSRARPASARKRERA